VRAGSREGTGAAAVAPGSDAHLPQHVSLHASGACAHVVSPGTAPGAGTGTVSGHVRPPAAVPLSETAAPVSATSHRKAAGRRWSAGSTVALYDHVGAKIPAGSTARPVKATIRYRLDGQSKKYTLKAPGLPEQIRQTQALLTLAYEQDWLADQHGRPIAPAALPAVGVHGGGGNRAATAANPIDAPSGAQVLTFPGRGDADQSEVAEKNDCADLPAAGVCPGPRDVASLVKWRKGHLGTTNSHRSGTGKRSPTTTDNYDTGLTFLLAHARYEEGDPRLAALGLPAGTPMRLDDPELGMNQQDLVALLTLRGATNYRTRAANERRMSRWAAAVVKEERAAARAGREPVLPATPALQEESVQARTIEGFAQTVRSALKDGLLHKQIGYQPWTPTVDAEVPHAAIPHYTTRTLPTREQVHQIADTLAGQWRESTTAAHHPCCVSGARYRALVVLGGREGPRAEEMIAARRSWVILDDGDPRIELAYAEVYHHQPGGGRERVHVPLKGRQEGEIRVVRLQPDTAQALRVHLEKFVSRPDPDAVTEDLRDPYLFTTHTGAPIDLSNFRSWFKAAVAAAFDTPADRHLLGTPFRRLRAAAITDWIFYGASSGEASEKAGNSVVVIEKHYRGVFASRPAPRAGPQPMTPGAGLPIDRLDDVQLAELTRDVMEEQRRRLDRDAGTLGLLPPARKEGP
jgi:hypothetical protein